MTAAAQVVPVVPAVPVRPVQPPYTAAVPVPAPLYPDYAGSNVTPPQTYGFTDFDIQQNIHNEFAADKMLRQFGIHVQVTNGIAILTGTADTWQDYQRAQADAYAAGAFAVDNRLSIRTGSVPQGPSR